MKRRKNSKLNKKQKKTLETMKKNRQLDSNNLREVIRQKAEWVNKEIKKADKVIEDTKAQKLRLQGVILFINDLLEPPLEEKE